MLGFNDYFCEDARGFAGGIWVLWNQNVVDIRILASDRQYVRFSWKFGSSSGLCTAIYGSPNPTIRRELWSRLRELSVDAKSPWTLICDFNTLLHPNEIRGSTSNRSVVNNDFVTCMSDCALIDLGFSGPNYTWFRGFLSERLDRAVCNPLWRTVF